MKTNKSFGDGIFQNVLMHYSYVIVKKFQTQSKRFIELLALFVISVSFSFDIEDVSSSS